MELDKFGTTLSSLIEVGKKEFFVKILANGSRKTLGNYMSGKKFPPAGNLDMLVAMLQGTPLADSQEFLSFLQLLDTPLYLAISSSVHEKLDLEQFDSQGYGLTISDYILEPKVWQQYEDYKELPSEVQSAVFSLYAHLCKVFTEDCEYLDAEKYIFVKEIKRGIENFRKRDSSLLILFPDGSAPADEKLPIEPKSERDRIKFYDGFNTVKEKPPFLLREELMQFCSILFSMYKDYFFHQQKKILQPTKYYTPTKIHASCEAINRFRRSFTNTYSFLSILEKSKAL